MILLYEHEICYGCIKIIQQTNCYQTVFVLKLYSRELLNLVYKFFNFFFIKKKLEYLPEQQNKLYVHLI